MGIRRKNLFCFFSGFAKQTIKVVELEMKSENDTVLLHCQNNGSHVLAIGEYIQLDGVLFEVVRVNGNQFVASTTVNLLEHASLFDFKPNGLVSLGILAEKDRHPELWMLQPTAFGHATYRGYSVLNGHQHTLKLDFEAPIAFLDSVIKENTHLGLAGSSLTAKEVFAAGDVVRFSIYCGKETRENSQFNESLNKDTEVSLTAGAAIYKKAPIP